MKKTLIALTLTVALFAGVVEANAKMMDACFHKRSLIQGGGWVVTTATSAAGCTGGDVWATGPIQPAQ